MNCPKLLVNLLLLVLWLTIFSTNLVKASEFNEIENEVTKLLKTRHLTELANELAANSSTLTKDLLIKISIFGRAGHRERVLETLKKLIPQITEFQTDVEKWRLRETITKAIGADFEARKIYYENFDQFGIDNAGIFVGQWKKQGDVKELEQWLFERKDKYIWREQWINLKKELGTAEEIYHEAEQEIRRNPTDYDKIRYYLNLVSPTQNIIWLLDVVPQETAYQTYFLANSIVAKNSELRIKLLEKSLTLPFTETEKERFIMDCAMRTQSGIVPKNPEKQLRYWTKKALLEIHNTNKRADLAQPYAEQLAALDTSDILWTDDNFINAGMTQSASGKRVIENIILQNEAEKKNSPQYWIERARYYRGRKEEELVWKAIEDALKIFPYKSKDQQILSNRLKILETIRWEGYTNRKKQIEILCSELPRIKHNISYLFTITRLTLSVTDEIKENCSLFFKDSDILVKILAVREKWDGNEHQIIESLLRSGIWSQKEREKVYEKLTVLAKQNHHERLPYLAYAMFQAKEYKMAIPLLQEYLKIIPRNYVDESKTETFKRHLFESFIEIQDWQNAEKMYSEGYSYWGYEAAIIAQVAAKTGDIGDAVRIWKIGANRDRRNLYLLADLAQTEAKLLLREFYLEIKQKDPLSDISDKALQILK